MTDIVDEANKTQARIERMQIEQVRQAANKLDAIATGYCLLCEEETLAPGQRWCDASCRDDWERMNSKSREVRL